jgi:flagellar protein FliO/FliZ
MSPADSCRMPRDLSRWLRLVMPMVALMACVSAFAAPTSDDQVIVPNSALNTKVPVGAAATGSGPLTLVGVLVLAGAGGWIMWRARAGGLNQLNRAPRQLAVEETRSLGNRQYLVVASYQEKKFLIGVCPGRIDLLSALDSTASVATEKTLS